MRHIDKGDAPPSFEDWKAQANVDWMPSWDVLQNPEKGAVKAALLAEQGRTCAYCCQRVEAETSHIDHIEPRTARPDLALDYGNMVASCEGEPRPGTDYAVHTPRPPELVHCGHAKGDWYDRARFVDPRRPGCEHAFSFTGSGAIRVASAAWDAAAAQKTIEQLNLDCGPLRRQRRAALDAELDRLMTILNARGTLRKTDVLPRIQALQQMGTDGRYAPFAPALIDVLEQRASTLP